MLMLSTVLAAALTIRLAPLAATQPCTPPANPLFEFQVDRGVAFVGDSTMRPRPAARRLVRIQDNPQALIVQVVVDTAGRPVVSSFRVLRSPAEGASDSARAAVAQWRFTPATKGGCKVAQLLQTALDR